MRTLGIDLSAQDRDTWVAVLRWRSGRATLVDLEGRQSDELITARAGKADVIGIDCPLGWPDAFVDFVQRHRTDPTAVTSVDLDHRRAIAYRETDRAVLQGSGGVVRPLSAATDRLGHVAMRCAGLLGTLAERGAEIDRSGTQGKVVEVYPAASLASWGLEPGRYKNTKGRPQLKTLVGELVDLTDGWLDLGEHRTTLERHDDAFDALVAALTARAARRDLTVPAPSKGSGKKSRPRKRVTREGWIHVPVEGSLARLAGTRG